MAKNGGGFVVGNPRRPQAAVDKKEKAVTKKLSKKAKKK
jgi:hypothetical protein